MVKGFSEDFGVFTCRPNGGSVDVVDFDSTRTLPVVCFSAVHENRRERGPAGHVRASRCAQVSDGRGRRRDGRTVGQHVRFHVPDAEDYLFHGPRRIVVQVSARVLEFLEIFSYGSKKSPTAIFKLSKVPCDTVGIKNRTPSTSVQRISC